MGCIPPRAPWSSDPKSTAAIWATPSPAIRSPIATASAIPGRCMSSRDGRQPPIARRRKMKSSRFSCTRQPGRSIFHASSDWHACERYLQGWAGSCAARNRRLPGGVPSVRTADVRLCLGAAKERPRFCQVLCTWQFPRPVRPTNDNESAVSVGISWRAATPVGHTENLAPARRQSCAAGRPAGKVPAGVMPVSYRQTMKADYDLEV
jgi:hypothetical protein